MHPPWALVIDVAALPSRAEAVFPDRDVTMLSAGELRSRKTPPLRGRVSRSWAARLTSSSSVSEGE